MRICCREKIVLDGEVAHVCRHHDPPAVMDVFGYYLRGKDGELLRLGDVAPLGVRTFVPGEGWVPEYARKKEEER